MTNFTTSTATAAKFYTNRERKSAAINHNISTIKMHYAVSDNIDRFKQTIEKLNGFKSLKRNWDLQGAVKIDSQAVTRAIQFVFENFTTDNILPLFIAPSRDGAVVVEYRFDAFVFKYRILSRKIFLIVIKNRNIVKTAIELTAANQDIYSNPILAYRIITM